MQVVLYTRVTEPMAVLTLFYHIETLVEIKDTEHVRLIIDRATQRHSAIMIDHSLIKPELAVEATAAPLREGTLTVCGIVQQVCQDAAIPRIGVAPDHVQ